MTDDQLPSGPTGDGDRLPAPQKGPKHELGDFRGHSAGRALSLETQAEGRSDYAGFIGASSAMQFVYEQIGRVAASSAPVFITGESGTGKDVCAEALHAEGPRRGKRMVAINCAAIPRDLM